jgi:tetratricopeptide (TPR) repeat protein
MKHLRLISIALVVTSLASSALSQAPTLARLGHENTPDISRPEIATRTDPTRASDHRSVALLESKWSRLAGQELFANSKLDRARSLAGRALERHPRDAEALFVLMEVAEMQADDVAVLDSALRLCELGRRPDDPRVRLATVRVRELAANTPQFRNVIPRLWSLVTNSPQSWPTLNSALLNAAMDGVPGLDPYALSRASGILTDWRIVSLGRHAMLDFDQSPISRADDLSKTSYQNQRVENFQFPDGRMVLPNYLQRHEMFYAASQFASFSPGNWTVSVEDADAAEVFIDGQMVLRLAAPQAAKRQHNSASFDVTAGPHRVLVKFVGSARPWRISILPSESPASNPPRPNVSSQELAYELAAEGYAARDFGAVIQQINAVHSAADSAALQFLLAQSWTQLSPLDSSGAKAWYTVLSLAPSALAADIALGNRALRSGTFVEASSLAGHVLMSRPLNVAALEILASAQVSERAGLTNKGDAWLRLLAVHPSCDVLQSAIQVYRARGRSEEANVAQQQLEGCAPESTAYARSLSERGEHAQAAQALQRLLAAAPLNRAARLMLVGEVQMAGNDSSARRAASEWLRIAPNAGNYHRLAGNDEVTTSAGSVSEGLSPAVDFYVPYRRDATQAVRQAPIGQFAAEALVLLGDRVAIARPDGSVSLYVHTVTRLLNPQGPEQGSETKVPQGAQILELRAIHGNGTVEPIEPQAGGAGLSSVKLSAGDVLDEEYVLHYAGDGGIPEHSEVFQFVFGSFNQQVLSARFVTLTPAEHADRGVVIATGSVPRMTARINDGMLARVWQKDAACDGGMPATANETMAIVRVVEEENGWTVPSNAEHRRRIETIHPGPRLEDSLLSVPRSESYAHSFKASPMAIDDPVRRDLRSIFR